MIILDIIKLRRRHRRATKPFPRDRPSAADKRLLSATMEAFAAYRAIFPGNSCWSGRDRAAFRRLESEITRYLEETGL